MVRSPRYVHTNLIARDWRALAGFYQRVLGCEVVPPERHFAGPTLEAGTGVPGARLDGAHLRLPGHGANGPTLEIFSYGTLAEHVPARNAQGPAARRKSSVGLLEIRRYSCGDLPSFAALATDLEHYVPARVNRPGFGHVAFEVESVVEARDEVLREGGRAVGEVVTLTTADGRHVTWCYVTDPEGNIIELQSWS